MSDETNITANERQGDGSAARNGADGQAMLHDLLAEIDARNAPDPARLATPIPSRRLADRPNLAHTSYVQDMVKHGRDYNFFELIRRIEWIEGKRVQSVDHGLFQDEFLTLKADNSLRFATSDLTRVEVTDPLGNRTSAKRSGRSRANPSLDPKSLDHSRSRKRPRHLVLEHDREERPMDRPWPFAGSRYGIEVAFFGLHGANSPLPSPTVELLAQGGRDQNVRKDFFDFFHHHWLKYVFQIWRKYRFAIAFEPGGTDRYSARVFALAGLYPEEMRAGDDIPWSRLLGYVGLMMIRTKTPEVVADIISKAFGLDQVLVRQFYRHWVNVPRYQLCYLAKSNCTLGLDSSLGDRVLSHSSKFVIEVGPVSPQVFFDLLPGQPMQRSLRRMVEFLLRDQLSFDLRVRVDTRVWQEPKQLPSNDNQRRRIAQARAPRVLGGNSEITLGRSQFLGQITSSEVQVQLNMEQG